MASSSVGPGELRLLRRLTINPELRPADLAAELDVTRSAVTQLWKKLVAERDLAIRGNLDLGELGLRLVFGWASSAETSDIIDKFSGWLKTSPFVTRMTRSVMSSTMDARVYFEAIIPVGRTEEWFLGQVSRFEKRPYSLSMKHGIATTTSHNTNMGLYDGTAWDFSNYFRLEASIGAAKGYVDVLPTVGSVDQSDVREPDLETLVYGAAIDDNYFATATMVAERFQEAGLSPPAGRTARRKLRQVRETLATPFVDLKNIGLKQKLLVCASEIEAEKSQLSRLLAAQASTFPRARVITGSGLTVLDLEVPEEVDWITMSQILSNLAGKTSEICTFIAGHHEIEKRLGSIVMLYKSAARSE